MSKAAERNDGLHPAITGLQRSFFARFIVMRSLLGILLPMVSGLIAFAVANLAQNSTNTPGGWVRAGMTTNAAVWGRKDRLQFALHPSGFGARDGGPRGLIRLGYPTLAGGQYDLINFIAVEPIANGKRGYSELEKSASDGKNGKLFWVGGPSLPKGALSVNPGEMTAPAPGVEQLNLQLWVERFENGAHVRLLLAQRSDQPDELALTVEAEADSAPIEMCILTATMGNKARARLLSLANGLVSSLQLWPDYRDFGFSSTRIFGFDQLPRSADGDLIVAILNDEEDPGKAQPFGQPHFWDYDGRKVTQYWKTRGATNSRDLACAVNGRFVYWGSKQPIPGGIAFENFELRERFRSGQTFVFGISRKAPELVKP